MAILIDTALTAVNPDAQTFNRTVQNKPSPNIASPVLTASKTGVATQPQRNLNGLIAETFGDLFFSKVYFIPPAVGFGNLVSETEMEVLMWNATGGSKTLTAIAYPTDQGVTVDGLQIPSSFVAYQLKSIMVTATLDGPPSFNFDIVATFSDATQYSFNTSGNRLVLFPYSPEGDFQESYEWLTSISNSYASEIRTKLRRKPRGTLTYRCVVDYNDVGVLVRRTKDWGFRTWGLPWWHYGEEVRGLLSGANVVPVSDDSVYKTDDSVILWVDRNTNHATTVSLVGSGFIQLNDPIPFDMPIAYLAPIIFARAPEGITVARTDGSWGETTVNFEMVTVDLPQENSLPTYKGEPYYPFPLVDGGIEEGSRQPFAKFDNAIGEPVYLATQANTPYSGQVSNRTINYQEYKDMLRFLNFASGRYKAFWLPSWDNEFKLAADAAIGESILLAEANTYLNNLGPENLFMFINGVLKPLQIESALLNPETQLVTIVLTDVLTEDIAASDVEVFGVMRRVRLSSDKVTINHDGKISARFNIPVIEPAQEG